MCRAGRLALDGGAQPGTAAGARVRPRRHGVPDGCPARASVWLRHEKDAAPGLFTLYQAGVRHPLPDDFCDAGENHPDGVLAWSVPDERPHATTAHRALHFVAPESGGVRLPVPELSPPERAPIKYTVYAIDPAGQMLVGDVLV